MKLPRCAVLGNQDHVPTRGNPPMQPHPLTKQTFDPIANRCVSYFLRHGEPEATDQLGLSPPACNPEHVPAMNLDALALNADEVSALSQPHLLRDSERSARTLHVTF